MCPWQTLFLHYLILFIATISSAPLAVFPLKSLGSFIKLHLSFTKGKPSENIPNQRETDKTAFKSFRVSLWQTETRSDLFHALDWNLAHLFENT